MKKLFFAFAWMYTVSLGAQTQVGDKWVDNELTLHVEFDKIKETGVFAFCVYQSAEKKCVSNLTTGLEIKVLDAAGKILWQGTAKGIKKSLKLPKKYPTAKTLVLRAFKPYVINKNTGTRIHQEAPIEITYNIK